MKVCVPPSNYPLIASTFADRSNAEANSGSGIPAKDAKQSAGGCFRGNALKIFLVTIWFDPFYPLDMRTRIDPMLQVRWRAFAMFGSSQPNRLITARTH